MKVRVTNLSSQEADDVVRYGAHDIKYEIVFDNEQEANAAATVLDKLMEEMKG